MATQILYGKPVAEQIKQRVATDAEVLRSQGIIPTLSVVIVGDNPPSATYVAAKQKACETVGIATRDIRLPKNTTQSELLDLITQLNRDATVHAILVQLPLPPHIDELAITDAVVPHKDVDGFHPYNLGKLVSGDAVVAPCTPAGIIKLLAFYNIPTVGKRAVIVGRSTIVGKPMALLLANRGAHADATVTIAHSKTEDLAAITLTADILIVAVGRPGCIVSEMVQPNAVIVDVGVNRITDTAHQKGYRLAGDVDFATVQQRVAAISPVPGGVGPLTIAMLLHNTIVLTRNATTVSR